MAGSNSKLDLLLDKKAHLEQALIITYDEEKKFALQRQIKDLEAEIQKAKAEVKEQEQLTSNASSTAQLGKDDTHTGKKIFFSYSQDDKNYLNQLLRHMAGLRRSGQLTPWRDEDILPGEEWDDAIKTQLAEADIILLLVSPDFLATDYIWKVEITAAMERHEKREARVVPIFIRPCDWSDMPFSKLNGLPSKAKPVSTFGDRDLAWLEVVNGIKRIL